jgi:hypothetical protein
MPDGTARALEQVAGLTERIVQAERMAGRKKGREDGGKQPEKKGFPHTLFCGKLQRIPEPEEALAAAVVEQAAADWRAAAAVLRKKPDHPGAAALRRETERFFRSRWFAQLTDLDGRLLLERLREGAGLSAAPGPEREREAWIREEREEHIRARKQIRRNAARRIRREGRN